MSKALLMIGSLLQTDQNGDLINESNVLKIKHPWTKVVKEIKTYYIDNVGKALHSVYVRGSVSRGMAIEGISDLDTFAVITTEIAEINSQWISDAKSIIPLKYPFATGVDIDLIELSKLDLETKSRLNRHAFMDQFTIKVMSACIYGEDLAPKMMPFQVNYQTAANLCVDLTTSYKKTKYGLANNTKPEYIKEWCQWAMKIILRSGFILVMPQSQSFTRDLYVCYQWFSRYFPSQQENMKMALSYAINPTEDKQLIIGFIDDFGGWLQNEISRAYTTQGPSNKVSPQNG